MPWSSPSNPDESRRLSSGVKHARFHDPDVAYHVVFRTLQGRFLIRPDRQGRLNSIVNGVIGRAQELFPGVVLFADAWLSNHVHLLLQGPPDDIPAFVGFLKREVSRRWGPYIDWPGTMWEPYGSTALPTPESERAAFSYVLAQSTKENLVTSPLQWPGVHCASTLVRGRTRKGIWFDGTRYGRARHRQRQRKRPQHVARRDYEVIAHVSLAKLPCLAHLSDRDYRQHVRSLIDATEKEGARNREGKRVLGRRRVLQIPREHRSELPRLPWYENRRRRVICWANRAAPQTQKYLCKYWNFQDRFREASRRFRDGDLQIAFPAGAFRPPAFTGPT